MNVRITSLLALAACALSAHAEPDKDRLTLHAAVSHPVVMCDRPQTIYIRVGLTGFDIEGRPSRAPVNLAIVIDRSGSMSGEKIERAKEAAAMAVNRLNPEDIVSVIAYESQVQVILPATKVRDKDMILDRIRRIHPGGSTALYSGVEAGAEEMRKFLSAHRVNRMILLSDGLANVGPSGADDLGRLGERLIRDGISVTTVGLGLGYNEDLMTQLAYRSDGSHYFAERACDLVKVFDNELGRALSVVAQQIEIEIRLGGGIRPVRVFGREGRIDGQSIFVSINQIYSRHEKYVLIEAEAPTGTRGRVLPVATVAVRYDNLQTRDRDTLGGELRIRYDASESAVEANLDRTVMVDVTEQIATERNEYALTLRDQGKLEEARQVLTGNAAYLYENADLYQSDRLRSYGEQNGEAGRNLDEAGWLRQRKVMREQQAEKRYQR